MISAIAMSTNAQALAFIFEDRADFAAKAQAERFLRERGFSFGASCAEPSGAPMPIGILHGDNVVVGKWRNLNDVQRASLHGTITTSDLRRGPVTVTIFAHAPAAARAAISLNAA